MRLAARARRIETALGPAVATSFDVAYEKFSANVLALMEHKGRGEPPEPCPLNAAETAVLRARGIRGLSSWVGYVLEHELAGQR